MEDTPGTAEVHPFNDADRIAELGEPEQGVPLVVNRVEQVIPVPRLTDLCYGWWQKP